QEKAEAEVLNQKQLRESEENHTKIYYEAEVKFQNKLITEIERQQKLKDEKIRLCEDFDLKIETNHKTQEELVAKMKRETAIQIAKIKKEIENLTQQNMLARQIHQKVISQAAADSDNEMEKMKLEYEKQLAVEQAEKFKLRSQEVMQRRQCEALTQQSLTFQDEIDQKEEDRQKILKEFDAFKESHETLLNEMTERGKVLNQKCMEAREMQLKYDKLQEENVMLENKNNEFGVIILPKDEKINAMKLSIAEMEQQLEEFHSSNNHLQMETVKLKKRITLQQQEIQKHRKKVAEGSNLIQVICNDIFECTLHMDDHNQLRKCVSSLFKKHAIHATTHSQAEP
ncbi:hypothetical protein IE077_001123, partial [Cardiosporidium cionae]